LGCDKLKPVIFIWIMWYNLFTEEKDLDNFLSTHLLLNKETLSHEMKDFEFHFIELQKFNKTECELDWIIDQWIYFLKIAEEWEIPKNRIEEILEAYETVQESNFTKREVEVMQWWEMRDLSNRNQALKEGLEQWLEQWKKNEF
jgi:predicted transposase/invertase (TIGR01784 family)